MENRRNWKENWRTNKNKQKIVREMKSKINLLEEAKTRDEHEQEKSKRIAIIKRFLHFDEVC